MRTYIQTDRQTYIQAKFIYREKSKLSIFFLKKPYCLVVRNHEILESPKHLNICISTHRVTLLSVEIFSGFAAGSSVFFPRKLDIFQCLHRAIAVPT